MSSRRIDYYTKAVYYFCSGKKVIPICGYMFYVLDLKIPKTLLQSLFLFVIDIFY